MVPSLLLLRVLRYRFLRCLELSIPSLVLVGDRMRPWVLVFVRCDATNIFVVAFVVEAVIGTASHDTMVAVAGWKLGKR